VQLTAQVQVDPCTQGRSSWRLKLAAGSLLRAASAAAEMGRASMIVM